MSPTMDCETNRIPHRIHHAFDVRKDDLYTERGSVGGTTTAQALRYCNRAAVEQTFDTDGSIVKMPNSRPEILP